MSERHCAVASFSLYNYDGGPEKPFGDTTIGGWPHPRDIETPDGVVARKWIPQTAFDSIWIVYEFESVESKQAFIANPPKVFGKATIRDTDDVIAPTEGKTFLQHWWANKEGK